MQVYDLKEIMLDIQELRKDLDGVAKRLSARGYDLNRRLFSDLEKERKTVQTETEALQAKRNAASKQIGMAKAKGEDVAAIMADVAGLGDELKAREEHLAHIQSLTQDLMLNIPNLPHETVSQGKSDVDNVEVRKIGVPRTFDFTVKDHADVGMPLGLDFDTGIKLSGARFTFMRGKIAKLHRALSQFMLDTQEKHGYEECYTPYLVNTETLVGTGQLPKFETDLFHVRLDIGSVLDREHGGENFMAAKRHLYLIPTSEVTLTNTVRDEIVPLETLPIKLTAHTPCFRSEAGRDRKSVV